MKRISLLFVCSLLGLSIMAQKGDKLDGTWVPIKQELGGDAFPKEVFETQKLTISGNQYTFQAETVDKGTLEYSKGKMTVTSTEGANAGKTFPAIYKLENGLLTICYNLGGTESPKGYDTKGEPTYFTAVFQKQ